MQVAVKVLRYRVESAEQGDKMRSVCIASLFPAPFQLFIQNKTAPG